MKKEIQEKLQQLSISDLKSILSICKKISKKNADYKKYAEWTDEVLFFKIDNIFTSEN